MDRTDLLIDVETLQAMRDDPRLRIIDVRYSLDGRDEGYALYEAGHIPGAAYLHWLDDWSDPDDPVEGQIAPPERFAEAMRTARVDDDSLVVAYDDASLFMAARLVWALHHYGHADARVLDGGFGAWQQAGGPVQSGRQVGRDPGGFTAREPVGDARLTKEDVQAILDAGDVPLLDCRMDRTWDETGQHIPGAGRMPSPSLVDDAGRLRDPEEIRALAIAQGVNPDGPVALYCGGGVSAAQAWLALRTAGFSRPKVYDGSWSEWNQDPDTPKAEH